MLLPRRKRSLVTSASSNEVAAALRSLIATRPWIVASSDDQMRPFRGRLSGNAFRFQRQSPWANAFRPVASGEILDTGSSTEVSLIIQAKRYAAALVLLWVAAAFAAGVMMFISADWRRSAPMFAGLAPIALAILAYGGWRGYLSLTARRLEDDFIRTSSRLLSRPWQGANSGDGPARGA